MPFRHLTAPARLFGDEFDNPAQAPGVKRVDLGILAIIPEVLDLLRNVEDAGRSDQIEQELLLILARRGSELRGEGLNGEPVRNVRNGAPPAYLGVRFSFAILDADVLDVEGHVDEAH